MEIERCPQVDLPPEIHDRVPESFLNPVLEKFGGSVIHLTEVDLIGL